ncbi:50S ribosomal protein L3 [Candidatus Falkowbacteria bacterium]|uniref:Large ribosomal subunit protein uL3 n=1 Tax=Candidatus Buchananbacteria bacterium CG10_big_fil_rev_8_21_14_0_10_33_19 TaxID=1974525 RepID=A0A2H0W310_9BACT|nr:50S ribosomal protein L3 [Candidatus Falkowbacteria bacterium]PIS05724.1 MAG: 50S ribosomal protein L3 [Candidatus Buchananbacteria bacterium CG10_big_fil_rev_8_21_14_0_10_33_19]
MKFILGKKLEMTQIFQENGRVVPVTAVLAEPNIVTQIKTEAKDKYSAVQVGFGFNKNLKKPQVGHLKGLTSVRTLKEFRVNSSEVEKVKTGDQITVAVFAANDEVRVTGTSKGRGYQGVVKRHGFHGSPASHGHKDQLRKGGSIGATDPARVFKGKKMAGRMGNDQISISGLSIVDIDKEKNILYIKGAVPGARNSLLVISGPGEMDLTVAKPEIKTEVVAEKVESTAVESEIVDTKVEETPAVETTEAKPEVAEVVETKTEENK